MSFLQVRKATVKFGALAAVNNLSFDVEKGEIFGIAGPNGAGKTTVFNMITGFYRCTGDVILDNERINNLRPHQVCHKGVARTFQIPQLYWTLPLIENVRVSAHFGVGDRLARKDERQHIAKVIALLGLQGKENTIVNNLNLYDKKRAMLAMAIATKPKLLLVDEVIAGLRPEEYEQQMDLIRGINRESGVTVIVIEHLMRVLTRLCNRLMIMHDGRKLALGHPQEVCEDEQVIHVYLGGR